MEKGFDKNRHELTANILIPSLKPLAVNSTLMDYGTFLYLE